MGIAEEQEWTRPSDLATAAKVWYLQQVIEHIFEYADLTECMALNPL